MQLFVANATQQYHDFQYRVPEGQKLIIQRIDPGSQIRISAKRGDLNQHDVDAIYDQHRKYGMIEVTEVGKRTHVGRLCPLVGSVDRPVPYDKIRTQILSNRAALEDQGRQARESAAVALNDQIENNIMQSGAPDVLREVEISVEEVKRATPMDRISRNDEDGIARELSSSKPIGEGIRVRKDAPAGNRRPRRTLR